MIHALLIQITSVVRSLAGWLYKPLALVGGLTVVWLLLMANAKLGGAAVPSKERSFAKGCHDGVAVKYLQSGVLDCWHAPGWNAHMAKESAR